MQLSASMGQFLARELKSYDPHNRLGRGSFGAVFAGVKRLAGTPVKEQAAAIKVQRAEDAGLAERKRSCLQRLMDRPHPNVIKIWAHFYDAPGQSVATVMEAGLGSLLYVQRQYSPGPRTHVQHSLSEPLSSLPRLHAACQCGSMGQLRLCFRAGSLPQPPGDAQRLEARQHHLHALGRTRIGQHISSRRRTPVDARRRSPCDATDHRGQTCGLRQRQSRHVQDWS